MSVDSQPPVAADGGPLHVRYESVDSVAVISLARAEKRNAQSVRLLYQLNDAFDRAAGDSAVNAIVLRGDGPMFSSGHDLRDGESPAAYRTVGTWAGFELEGAEGWMGREEEIYLGLCRRWWELPKPTIAAVHGKNIAGALMLMWVCDLIVAADDALFCDPVVAMGVNGVEWFSHPWELGHRKAKELLFTGDFFDAAEAHRLGMVNHVVPGADLDAFTLGLAKRIATKPSFALKLAKESVNQTMLAQGFGQALASAFGLHQLSHSHNQERFGQRIDPGGVPGGVGFTPPPAHSA